MKGSSIKAKLVRASGPLGLYSLAWWLTRRRPRIFMYHRFAATDSSRKIGRETFRRHIRMIRRRCRIVTLRELARTLRERPENAQGLAVLTIDDGYKDFYDFALPVLREEEAPATFFPVTGFVDREVWLWPDLVEHALESTGHRVLNAMDLGLLHSKECWVLEDRAQLRRAWQFLIDHAIDLADADKWVFLRELYGVLKLGWPDVAPEKYAPVLWDDLREIVAAGLEIGAHTRTHCRLTRVSDDQLEEELLGSRQRLEEETGTSVESLCYPNGVSLDYDGRVIMAAKALGYRSAVTAFFDGRQGDIYELRRHSVSSDTHTFLKSLCGIDELSYRLV